MGADKDKRACPAFPVGAAVRAKHKVQSSKEIPSCKLQNPPGPLNFPAGFPPKTSRNPNEIREILVTRDHLFRWRERFWHSGRCTSHRPTFNTEHPTSNVLYLLEPPPGQFWRDLIRANRVFAVQRLRET